MSRSLNNSLVALAALTLMAVTAAEATACGGGGGRGGYRSSSRLSINYHRKVPHMRSQAPRSSYGHVAPSYGQPVYSQPVAPQQTFQQPSLQQPALQQPIAQQPVTQQPVAPQPTTAPAASAQQSALDALGSLGGGAAGSPIPQFQPAKPAVAPHLGSWIATLPGDNRVQLRLNGDGTFRWVAVSRGKESSFDGSFIVENGQLTLTRDGDRQQLAGGWASENGGFRFTLSGSSDGGLLFNRG